MNKYDVEIDKLESKITELKKKRDVYNMKKYVPIGEIVVEILGDNVLEMKKKSELKAFLLDKFNNSTKTEGSV